MRVIINNIEYEFFGKVAGSNLNKWNRVAKLAHKFSELDSKFKAMSERGNYSTHIARCATAVRMLMHSGIRVGNESSAEGYITKPHPNDKTRQAEFVQTYGLTTLKWEHLELTNRSCKISFTGKRSIENSFKLSDTNLVKAITEMATYDTDTIFDLSAYELTKFIKKYVGRSFSPKDFRTLRANMYAWECWLEQPFPETNKELKEQIKEVSEFVSSKLCNTPAVCKKSYLDDMLFEHMSENLG